MSDLLNHELNQVGWSGDSLLEADDGALFKAATSLSKAIGAEIFLQIMAEENNDHERARHEELLIDKLKNNFRRMVRIHLDSRNDNVSS